MNKAEKFAQQMRSRKSTLGYWSMLDSTVAVERIARVGYDYVCIDAQHGFASYTGQLSSLMAIDASPNTVGLVRVPSNSVTEIAKALDAGAVGVIVPFINDVEGAQLAASACRYPPRGVRSYGPIRSALGQATGTLERDKDMLCLAMIETTEGLANVADICAVPGIDGVYVGPSDLSLAMGARYPGDASIEKEFGLALEKILRAAQSAGIAAGIHCSSGELAAQRLKMGFTFASVASDINHLEQIAVDHLEAARTNQTPQYNNLNEVEKIGSNSK